MSNLNSNAHDARTRKGGTKRGGSVAGAPPMERGGPLSQKMGSRSTLDAWINRMPLGPRWKPKPVVCVCGYDGSRRERLHLLQGRRMRRFHALTRRAMGSSDRIYRSISVIRLAKARLGDHEFDQSGSRVQREHDEAQVAVDAHAVLPAQLQQQGTGDTAFDSECVAGGETVEGVDVDSVELLQRGLMSRIKTLELRHDWRGVLAALVSPRLSLQILYCADSTGSSTSRDPPTSLVHDTGTRDHVMDVSAVQYLSLNLIPRYPRYCHKFDEPCHCDLLEKRLGNVTCLQYWKRWTHVLRFGHPQSAFVAIYSRKMRMVYSTLRRYQLSSSPLQNSRFECPCT